MRYLKQYKIIKNLSQIYIWNYQIQIGYEIKENNL